MTRNRPNSWLNRYNQWTLAGKIALQTHAVPDISASLAKGYDAMHNNIYFAADNSTPHYSLIGQEYLRRLNITVTNLE